MNLIGRALAYVPRARTLVVLFILSTGAVAGGSVIAHGHHNPLGYLLSLPGVVVLAYSLGKALFGTPRL